MFVIPCKYVVGSEYVFDLVESIRKFHPTEKIVVVDSDSDDKTYFSKLEKYDIIIEDVKNKHRGPGAFWYAYKKYPNEDFYFFMHDSMIVKDNLDYLKQNDVTTLMYFDRNQANWNNWAEHINANSKYTYNLHGFGCMGPIFFCKNKVMKHMLEMGADKFIPSNYEELGYCEACYGFFLEEQGYNLKECALHGDALGDAQEKLGPFPHNTSWQFPVEKIYGERTKHYH